MGTTNKKSRMSQLTPFGISVRKLRVDHDEYQRDMASRLNVTVSYLSAVERGRRNVPSDWARRIGQIYELDTADIARLEKEASNSRTYDRLDISNLNYDDKRLIGEIAAALPTLSRDIKTSLYLSLHDE